MSVYSKLASAIYNSVVDGLRGLHQTANISLEQLEDDVIDERLSIIKEYTLKGLIPKKELLLSINCIPVDCLSIDRCRCVPQNCQETEVAHFEIPLILMDFGSESIEYIGTTDRQLPFVVYTSPTLLRYNKYRKRGNNRPFVFLDYTPNVNNMNDGFIFNAPLLQLLTAVIIPKDPRLLEQYGCCPTEDIENMTFINAEIKARVINKYVNYFRKLLIPMVQPNDLTPQP